MIVRKGSRSCCGLCGSTEVEIVKSQPWARPKVNNKRLRWLRCKTCRASAKTVETWTRNESEIVERWRPADSR